MSTIEEHPCEAITFIWIAGYKNRDLVFHQIIGKEISNKAYTWELETPEIEGNRPHYSGAYWATHYAASCPFPFSVDAPKNVEVYLRTIIEAICRVDVQLPLIDNTVGGEVKTIIALPPTE